MSKIVLVGANHAGIAAANTILDNYPGHQLVIIDANTNLSYLGCGTALWVGRQIPSYEGLFYTNKDAFTSRGATVYMETRVESINFDEKKVFAKKNDGSTFEESYDKLILATGSVPIIPNIPGKDLENIQFLKLFQDGQKADIALAKEEIKNVAIVGAGYIGVEMAEAAKRRGKNVLLFDSAETCLVNYYDKWFTDDMDKVLKENGIETHYNELVQEYKGDNGKVKKIVTNKGEYDVDLVFMAIGFKPNNALGKDRLALFDNGAYLVDKHQQTSIQDVYAVGDCATIFDNAKQKTSYIALATNAVRSGIVAGHNVCGTDLSAIGVQGSNGISIFGHNMVSTGLNLHAAEKAGFKPMHTDYEDNQLPEFMPHNDKVKIRIIYDENSRVILGAQLASTKDISMAIHMFSLAIEEQVTIDKLKLLDIFFLPHFNKPYNYITMAAISAK